MRLAPKKPQAPTPVVQEQTPKPVAAAAPAKKNQGFGGMKGGFLLGGGAPKKAAPKKATAEPKIEDVTHVKAKGKNSALELTEVQEAMKSRLVQNKDEWLTPEFYKKL